jgi:hypothetical protein
MNTIFHNVMAITVVALMISTFVIELSVMV